MEIYSNYSLKDLNTFKIDVSAKYYAKANSIDQLKQILASEEFNSSANHLILGGGSNILFTQDFDGFVISIEIKGIKLIDEDADSVVLEVGAGEDWDGFVKYTCEKEYDGIENMAAIPGTVGAAPVQNIAAYGHNQEDVFESLEAVELSTGTSKTFQKKNCKFEYRDSIFKNELKDKFAVVAVRYRLKKSFKPNTSYYEIHLRKESPIEVELKEWAKEPYKPIDVYNAVHRVRARRLPDYKKFPNSGSFFKNPVISKEKLGELQSKVDDLQFYPAEKLEYDDMQSHKEDEYVKVALGRLVDELGWRGKVIGNVGSHEKQALFLYTNGNATGKEVLELSKKIQQDVYENYGIKIHPEVRIV